MSEATGRWVAVETNALSRCILRILFDARDRDAHARRCCGAAWYAHLEAHEGLLRVSGARVVPTRLVEHRVRNGDRTRCRRGDRVAPEYRARHVRGELKPQGQRASACCESDSQARTLGSDGYRGRAGSVLAHVEADVADTGVAVRHRGRAYGACHR